MNSLPETLTLESEPTPEAGQPRSLSVAPGYASGELPQRGDVIVYADKKCIHPEANEVWVVTSVTDDMVRAKCEHAPAWRQAFYTSHMNLARRKNENAANRKHNPAISHAASGAGRSP